MKASKTSLGERQELNETVDKPSTVAPSRNFPRLDLKLARAHADSAQDAASASSSSSSVSSGDGHFRGFRLHFPGFSSRQNSLQEDDDKEKPVDSTPETATAITEEKIWPSLVENGDVGSSSPVFLSNKKRLYNVPKVSKKSNATKKLRLDSVTVDDQRTGQVDIPSSSSISTGLKKSSGEFSTEQRRGKTSCSDGPVSRRTSLDLIQGVDDTLAYIRKIVTDTSKKMEQLCSSKKEPCDEESTKTPKSEVTSAMSVDSSSKTDVGCSGLSEGEGVRSGSATAQLAEKSEATRPVFDSSTEPGTSNNLGEGASGIDKSSQVDASKLFSPFWHWPSPSSSPKVAVVSPLAKPVPPKQQEHSEDSGNVVHNGDQTRSVADHAVPSSSGNHHSETANSGRTSSRSSGRCNHSGASTSSGRGMMDGGHRECGGHGSPIARGHKKSPGVRPVHSFATREKGVNFLDISSSDSEEDPSRWLAENCGPIPSRSRKRGARTTKSCSHLVHRRPVLDSSSDSEVDARNCCPKIMELPGSNRSLQCLHPKSAVQSCKKPSVGVTDKRALAHEWMNNVSGTHPCVMRTAVTSGPSPRALRLDLLCADNSSDSDSPLMLRHCRRFSSSNPGSASKSKASLSAKRSSYRRPFDVEDSSTSTSEADLPKSSCPSSGNARPSRDKLTSQKSDGSSKKWRTLFNRPLDPNVFTADSSDNDEQPSRPCRQTSGNAGSSFWNSHGRQPMYNDSTDSDGETFPQLSTLSPQRTAPVRTSVGRRAVVVDDEDLHRRLHPNGGRSRQNCNLRRNARSTPDLRSDTTITLDASDELDPVQRIEQIEADEAYARMLQAQFDAELAANLPQSPHPVTSDVELDAGYVPTRGLSAGQHRYPRTRQSARMTCPSSSGYRNQRGPTTRQASARSPSQQSLLNASRHRQGCSRMRGSHDSLTTLLPMLEDVVGYHGNLVDFLSSIANLPVIRPQADLPDGSRAWNAARPGGNRRHHANARNAISDESDIDPILFVGDPLEYLLYTDDEDDRWPPSGLRRSTHGGPGTRRRTPRGHRNRGAAMAGVTTWTFNDGNDYEELLELAERLGHVSRGLTNSQVNRLPTRLFSRGEATAASSSQRSTECHICMSDYETGERLRILPCFHEFHTNCIDRWLVEKNTCPVCRLRVQVN